MNWIARCVFSLCAAAGLAAAVPAAGVRASGTVQKQVEVDPQTGRAVGAKEMTPEELRSLIGKQGNRLIIDVRDSAQHETESIPGAVHWPFSELEARLKDIPKDTTLVFT